MLEEGSSPSLTDDGSSTKVGKRSSSVKAAASQQSAESMTTPNTPQLPQPGQLSLVVASVVHGRSGVTLAQDGSGSLVLTALPVQETPLQEVTKAIIM